MLKDKKLMVSIGTGKSRQPLGVIDATAYDYLKKACKAKSLGYREVLPHLHWKGDVAVTRPEVEIFFERMGNHDIF